MAEIAEAASYLSPKTEAGAAFQVMLASAEVDTIQIGADASQLQTSKLMVQRPLYRSLEMMGTEVAEFPMSKSLHDVGGVRSTCGSKRLSAGKCCWGL
jgi:hypothetical protein